MASCGDGPNKLYCTAESDPHLEKARWVDSSLNMFNWAEHWMGERFIPARVCNDGMAVPWLASYIEVDGARVHRDAELPIPAPAECG